MIKEGHGKSEIKMVLKQLRSERADHLKAVQARIKTNMTLRNKVKKALKNGPQTVPAIANAVGESTDQVLWTIMSMRVYGLIAEDKQDGDYFKYGLAPVTKRGA
jgi:hypothetical protein